MAFKGSGSGRDDKPRVRELVNVLGVGPSSRRRGVESGMMSKKTKKAVDLWSGRVMGVCHDAQTSVQMRREKGERSEENTTTRQGRRGDNKTLMGLFVPCARSLLGTIPSFTHSTGNETHRSPY